MKLVNRINSRSLLLPVLLFALAVLIGWFVVKGFIKQCERDLNAVNTKPESRPNQNHLTTAEYNIHLDYLKSLGRNKVKLKSFNPDDTSYYANGRLKGTWHPKVSHTNYYGYRVDNSAYDSLRDVFYAVSYAGHLYKLDTSNGVSWKLLNHKIQLNPNNNNTANPIFLGYLLADSTFRMFRSNDELGICEYSDDEGKNWNDVSGVSVDRSWANNGISLADSSGQKILLLCEKSGKLIPYISYDQGISFNPSLHQFSVSTYDVRLVKPYHSNEAYLLVFNKSTDKTYLYVYDHAINDYNLVQTSDHAISGNYISNAEATFKNGLYHFYLSTHNGQNTIYYSNDKGKTWSLKNAGRERTFERMHPDKPEILFSGFDDVYMSTDFGANWAGFSHKLGWDMQHMKVYEKKDGSYLTFIGLDFGCYISSSPENKDNYTWINNGAWYAMHYDAATSENFNTIYMANQDRGATAYMDSGNHVNTIDIDGTDVLRVACANHELSVWTWFYYGRIKRKSNVGAKGAGEAIYDGLGNWWAAPLVASPNPSEDAVYAAYGSNLQVFKYNEAKGSIEKSVHPHNFYNDWKWEIGGFGYSELNRNLWYVSLLNGRFLYSHDGGTSWNSSTYTGGKPRGNDQTYNYHKNQLVIKASLNDTMKVYYVGVGNYFLMSEDGGVTFTNKANGLNVYRIRDFDVSPDDKFIFAACGYGGAWVYSTEENSWFQMNDEAIPYVDFTDVQYIKKKNLVRFATYGSGIIDFKLESDGNEHLASPQHLQATLLDDSRIGLEWEHGGEEISGYVLERALDGDFEILDTIGMNTKLYIDSLVAYNKTYYYRLKSFQSDKHSHYSNIDYIKTPEKGILISSEWRIMYTDSEELNGEYAPVKYAFDNNASTFWHTQWQGIQPSHPHEVQVDMDKINKVAGFRYLPRQDGSSNGSIASYEFYVSNDTLNWNSPVSSGSFNTNSGWKEILFNSTYNARYFRIRALSEMNGSNYTSAAEFSVLYDAVPPLKPENVNLTPYSTSLLRITWNDVSFNENGYIIEYLKDGKFIWLDSLAANSGLFLHKDLASGTQMTYRIASFNEAGISEYSEVVTGSTKVTGTVDIVNEGFKIYPNPVGNELNIELMPENSIYAIQLFDINGKLIRSKEIKKGTHRIHLSVSGLQSGYYLLYLQGMEKSMMKKVYKY